MMATERSDITSINRIASYLKVPAGKVGVNKENVVCRSVKNKTLCGFASIVNQLARESKDLNLDEKDLATQCLITQWFEYAVLFVVPAGNSKHTAEIVLRELDEYLLSRSYLVGQSLTIADAVLFYSLHPIMSGLSAVTKEQLINVSRWFDHLQHNRAIRHNLAAINFSNTYLHGWAIGTHV